MPEIREKPYTSKYDGTKLTITIPGKRNWFQVLFLGFWLTVWAFGEITVCRIIAAGIFTLITGNIPAENITGILAISLFVLLWISGWTLGGTVAISNFLWQITGKEIIEVSKDILSIRYKIFSFGKPKEYPFQYIKNLRSIPVIERDFWGRRKNSWWWGKKTGAIAFDFGAKTIHFGSECNEAEGKMILNEIRNTYPQYKNS